MTLMRKQSTISMLMATSRNLEMKMSGEQISLTHKKRIGTSKDCLVNVLRWLYLMTPRVETGLFTIKVGSEHLTLETKPRRNAS